MQLLLQNITWLDDGVQLVTGNLRIIDGVITDLGDLKKEKQDVSIDFPNHFLYPGMINAHDHLEMNLYPKMGTPHYQNYVEWARDIYKPKESPIREIERVNIKDRLIWGGFKNLIAGATTVVHHNPWHSELSNRHFPIHVLEKMAWAHSMAFGKNVEEEFMRAHGKPFVIHAAEGVDSLAQDEIDKLSNLNLLQPNTVLIHAVALDEVSIKKISDKKVSLVWCPASNLFMFKATSPVNILKNKLRVALGTDSTMTGSSTLLEEMKVAFETRMVTPKEIYEMVTFTASSIFSCAVPGIKSGREANFFIAPKIHENYYENLVQLNPQDIILVMSKGEIQLIDSFVGISNKTLRHTVSLNDRLKQTTIDIDELKKRIEKSVSLSILEKNQLWMMIH